MVSILLVDDASDIRSLLCRILEQAGYADIRAVGSAEEALAELSFRPADVVLLDLFLPGMDGISLCQALKADRTLHRILVLAISARSDGHPLERAFEAGAIDFIRKPIDRIELLARLRSALRLKEEMDRTRDRERDLLETAAGLRHANQALERLSMLDGLTGIPNRRSFDLFFDSERRRCQRFGRPLGLLIADIDEFKAYNDTLGHPAGDVCLRQVARTLVSLARRPTDLVARYGGEEFGIILGETDAVGARAIARAARDAVVSLEILHPHSPHGIVTISLGVAASTDEVSGRTLIDRADAALYRAKRAGRNQFSEAALPLGTDV